MRSFVGRARELDELRTALDESSAGKGSLILVSGEPGIGKTRLAEELSDHARAPDRLVAWGRCWEAEGIPAFWPWMQVIRSLAAAFPPAEVAALLGAGASYVAGILPELAAKLGDVPPPATSAESEHARFYLFDAVTTLVKRVSRKRPLLVVLDDLHWADRSSLLLLEFLARELRDARILAIGTYREGDVHSDASLADVAGGLSRVARSIHLRGLSEAEVGLLMERAGGRKPDPLLVAAVYRNTDGNPFFASEIVRLLTAEGWMADRPGERLPIPEGVRAAVRRRVARLPAEVRELLAMGSVAGPEFDVAVLERVSGRGTGELLGALATARRAGLLSRPQGRAGAFGFAHAVIRETLYDDLPLAERLQHHRRIGEALEDLHSADVDSRIPELAHHFLEAAPAGVGEKALAYAARAGALALRLLAYEEATGYFERALRVADRHGIGDRALRFELRLSLGEAQKRAGRREAARASFADAARSALASRAAVDLARAALGYPWSAAGIGKPPEPPDETLLGWCRNALAWLPAEETSLRSQLLARMAGELDLTPRSAECVALSAEAVRLARSAGDPAVLGGVLMTRYLVRQGPGSTAERLELADEIVRIAEETGNRDLRISGHYARTIALFEIGARAAVDREIAAQTRVAEELREPRYRWIPAMYRAARAIVSGDFAAGERLAREALTLGEAADEAKSAAVIFGLQMLVPWRERGERQELAVLATMVREWAEENPTFRAWRYILIWLLVESGDETVARRELDAIDPREFEKLPRDLTWLLETTMLAEAATRLGDGPRALALHDQLLSFADHHVTVFCSFSMFGSVAHYLGLVEASLGRDESAERHFEDAIARSGAAGARSWACRSRIQLAELLLRRRGAGDLERASRLLEEALPAADDLGMTVLAEHARRLKDTCAPAATLTPSPTLQPSRLLRDGNHWTISHRGVTFRMKDSKGLRMIAHLLRYPGLECHVAELVPLAGNGTGDEPARVDAAALAAEGLRIGGLGDAGDLLDTRAKAAYRARLTDLREELDEALRNNDTGHAAAARREIEFLGVEISRAVGLGGRDRKAAAASERARINVTRSIRTAIDRISDLCPALQAHLSDAIRTGTFCCYQPDPGTGVSWAFDPD